MNKIPRGEISKIVTTISNESLQRELERLRFQHEQDQREIQRLKSILPSPNDNLSEEDIPDHLKTFIHNEILNTFKNNCFTITLQ